MTFWVEFECENSRREHVGLGEQHTKQVMEEEQ